MHKKAIKPSHDNLAYEHYPHGSLLVLCNYLIILPDYTMVIFEVTMTHLLSALTVLEVSLF